MGYKIGVIGDKNSILPFKLFGFEVHHAISEMQVREAIETMAKNKFGVIFITEEASTLAEETIERYKEQVTPAIILIPSHNGTIGIGLSEIEKMLKKQLDKIFYNAKENERANWKNCQSFRSFDFS